MCHHNDTGRTVTVNLCKYYNTYSGVYVTTVLNSSRNARFYEKLNMVTLLIHDDGCSCAHCVLISSKHAVYNSVVYYEGNKK